MGLISAIIGWLQYHLGLRTDAASASGSLHAKVVNANNHIIAAQNTIGTASDTRSNNTVMGWLNSPVRSVQHGILWMRAADLSATATITTVNLQKAVILLTGVSGGGGGIPTPGATYVHLRLSSTTVTAYRGGSAAGDVNALWIGWQVIEFY